jgi:hypothetical protein
MIIAVSLVAMSLAATAGAGTHTISYQGVLRDATGTPVPDGFYEFAFSLHDTAVGGNQLWDEQQSLYVEGGIFNALLGAVEVLELQFDRTYWLEVRAAGETMAPRTELAAAPYALRASVAEYALSGGEGDSDWIMVGDDMHSTVSGHVGIGTASPNAPLHVHGHNANGTTLELTRGDPNRKLLLGATSDETAGKIQAWDYGSRGALNLALQQTGGNVGIGTASPVTTLHAYRNTAGVGATGGILIDQDGTGDSAISFRLMGSEQFVVGLDNSDGDKFKISDGSNFGVDRLVIDASGRVGIGTATPQALLNLSGTHPDVTFNEGAFNAAKISHQGAYNTGYLQLQSYSSGWTTAGLIIRGTEGNVGIGTTNPEYRLDVAGSVRAGFFHGDGSNLTGISGTSDNDWQIGTGKIWTDNLVGVGPNAHNPAEPLVVTGTKNALDPLVRITNSGSGHGILVRTGAGGAEGSALEADNTHEGFGSTYGVKGITRAAGRDSASAVGVIGISTHDGYVDGGATFGVLGRTHGSKDPESLASVPAGVFGEAVATSGIAWGVDAETYSGTYKSAGLKAIARSATGQAFGAHVVNNSSSGTGLLVQMPSDSDLGILCEGRIEATGSISVKARKGAASNAYALLAASEAVFDMGDARLVGGRAAVAMTTDFAAIAADSVRYLVTFYGPHGSYYVVPGDGGFEIIEETGSDSPFSWFAFSGVQKP